MAEPSLAITTDYVKCFLALMGTDITWLESVLLGLEPQGLDKLDVIHVVRHGDVTETEKETADGSDFVMVGATCDDVVICVRFWSDPNQMRMTIKEVTRV